MDNSIDMAIIEKLREEKYIHKPLDPPSFLNRVLSGTAFVTFSGLLFGSFKAAMKLPDHWTPKHRFWCTAFVTSYIGLSLICVKYGLESTGNGDTEQKVKFEKPQLKP